MVEWSSREAAEVAAEAMHLVDLHTPSAKDAVKSGGARAMKTTTEVGPAMDKNFMDGTQGEDAPPPLPPPPALETAVEPPFSMAELRHFPMRASCLSTHTTIPDLPPWLRDRLLRYLADAIDGLPELRDAVLLVERVAPQFTRVKELIESAEAFKLIAAYLSTVERRHRVDSFFDLACGHGLVAVMLAYAYPERKVMACDRFRRPVFDIFARALGAFAAAEAAGTPMPAVSNAAMDGAGVRDIGTHRESENGVEAGTPEGTVRGTRHGMEKRTGRGEGAGRGDDAAVEAGQHLARKTADAAKAAVAAGAQTFDLPAALAALPPGNLPNLEFVEGELGVLKPHMNERSLVLALHGCNEANKESMDMALDARALWCVMPCCIMSDLYLPECTVSKLTDDARYAFVCGAMAAKYGAQMARCIDKRITNRALMLCGGCDTSKEEAAAAAAGDGPFKLKFYSDGNKKSGRAAARAAAKATAAK